MQSIDDVVHRIMHDPAFDNWLQPHHRSVERASVELAHRLALETDTVSLAARCHDVGKLAISRNIWDKPGPLTPMERRIVALHSEIGEEMVAPINRDIKRIIRHHHEAYDGLGYPDGLASTAIPIQSRIIAVADAFDSLITDRPYRKGTNPVNALMEIWRCSGSQLDPLVVRALEDIVRQGFFERYVPLSSFQRKDQAV